MSRSIYERYEQMCHQSGVFTQSAVQGCCASSWRLHPSFGRGWMNIAHIGLGMSVGRAAYTFHAPYRHTYTELPDSLCIAIMLTGRVRFRPSAADPQTVDGGTLVLWNRSLEASEVTYDLRPGDTMHGVSIDLPVPLVRELGEEDAGGRGSVLGRVLARPEPLYARLDKPATLAAAHALLHTPAGSVVERLRLESAALGLLADLLGGGLLALGSGALPRRQRAAVDEAVAIMEAEFADSHTIASLAQRVGLNQCYLKHAFRVCTGQTIARYLRDVRMKRARDMIEGGRHTVQETALFVGYSNPSHFAAAFREVHGLPPSRLR